MKIFARITRSLGIIVASAAVGAFVVAMWVYAASEIWELLNPPPRASGVDVASLYAVIFGIPSGFFLGTIAGIWILVARPRWRIWPARSTGQMPVERWSPPLDLTSLPRYPTSAG